MQLPEDDQKPRTANAPKKRAQARAPKAPPNQHAEPPIAPLHTSGKTQGPHNPSFGKEDLEYFRTHLLSSKPLARFDTFGTVSHVLADIDRCVPEVFGSEGEKALNTLHKVIRHYSVNEKWTYVVASLSLGMARHEIETLLARKLGNTGPIIIDPDASAETHQIFGSETEARIQKERVIQANEATGKILLVLYAIDNPDGQKDREKTHLQDLAKVLGVLLEEDAKFRSLWALPPLDGNIKERLEKIGLKIGEKEDPHAFGLHMMHAVFMEMRGIEAASALPIYMAIRRFGIIPSRWANLGIVDDEAEFQKELGRLAEEHRAKLARGWKSPEEKLREAAAHAENERHKQAAEAEEHRRHATAHAAPAHRETEPKHEAPHSAKEAASARLGHERDARHAREDDAEAARDRSRLLYREAREDKLHDEHMAEDARLEGLEFAAVGAEKSFFAQERAEADSGFEISEEQETNIETRERRNAQNEAGESLEGEGTAEGPYSRLAETASELREDALDQRQRNEYALETRREGSREADDISDESRDFAELREATPPQGEATVARANQKEEMRNEQAATVERPAAQNEAQNENQQELRNNEPPPGAPRPQDEQANPLESQAPKDAPGTQTPDARAALLEQTQPDEANNPDLTENRRVVAEMQHPATQGELDTNWPQNAERLQQQAAREEMKQEQILQQVDRQSEVPAAPPEEQRAEALANVERDQREFLQQQNEQAQEIAARQQQEEQAQKDLGDNVKKTGEELDRVADRLEDMVKENPDDRAEKEEAAKLIAAKEAEQEIREKQPSEEKIKQQATDTMINVTTAEEDTPSDPNYVPEQLEVVLDAMLNNEQEMDDEKKERRDVKNALAEEAAESPPPAPPTLEAG